MGNKPAYAFTYTLGKLTPLQRSKLLMEIIDFATTQLGIDASLFEKGQKGRLVAVLVRQIEAGESEKVFYDTCAQMGLDVTISQVLIDFIRGRFGIDVENL